MEEQFTSYIRIFGSTWKVGVQILSQNCGETEKERFNWVPYASSSPETTKLRIASKSFSFFVWSLRVSNKLDTFY